MNYFRGRMFSELYSELELSWTHRIASANPSFFRGIHSGLSRIILEEEWSVSYPELELSWTHSIDNLIHSGLLWIILEEECSVSYSDECHTYQREQCEDREGKNIFIYKYIFLCLQNVWLKILFKWGGKSVVKNRYSIFRWNLQNSG